MREGLLAFPRHWVSLWQLRGGVSAKPQMRPLDTEALGRKCQDRAGCFSGMAQVQPCLKPRKAPECLAKKGLLQCVRSHWWALEWVPEPQSS